MTRHFRFGDFRLDPQRRTLVKGDAAVPITARAFDILLVLLAERHRIVDKDELLTRVWPDQVVEEGNLSQHVFVLRRLLGEGQFIATVPRRGYQFVAPVSEQVLPDAEAPPADGALLRLVLPLDPPAVLGPNPAFTVARDGRLLVYVGEHAGATALFVRRLDARAAHLVAGSEGAEAPFLSPDARWIGFAARDRLYRIAVTGGPPVPICEVDGVGRGASWGPQNVVVFAPVAAGPLFVVPATGGAARQLTRLAFGAGERSHRFPRMSADGDHVVFTIACAGDASFDDARIAVANLASGAHRVLLADASCPMLAGADRLQYHRSGVLFSTRCDVAAGTCDAAGEPREHVAVHPAGAMHVAIADSGVLVYAPPIPPLQPARLVWRDAEGGEMSLGDLPGVPEEPRISPDGLRVVFGVRADTSDLWLCDLRRRTMSRLTERGDNFAAVWTPGGDAVVFSSNRDGPANLYRQPIGTADAARRLTRSDSEQVPGAFTRDGGLLFTQYDMHGAALWMLEGETPRPLARTRFSEFAPAISSDGIWLAYTSEASGGAEVWVIRLPDGTDRQQVSRGGGVEPVWQPGTRRLYYRAPDGLVRVDVTDEGVVSDPQRMAADGYVRGSPAGLANYDVHPDGRLLLIAPPAIEVRRDCLHVVVPSPALR